MRMQKPYEEGSILLDAPQHDTMDELVELARDKEEWQGTANVIYLPCKTIAIDYTSGSDNTPMVLGLVGLSSKSFGSIRIFVQICADGFEALTCIVPT